MNTQPERRKSEFNPLKALGKLSAAVGGPVAAWSALSQWAFKHRTLAFALVISYEILLFFIGEIWKRLKDPWMDAIAQRLAYRLQEIGYRGKYLKHLFYE